MTSIYCEQATYYQELHRACSLPSRGTQSTEGEKHGNTWSLKVRTDAVRALREASMPLLL